MLAIKIPRKREPQKLPDILSASEVERIIKVTPNLKYRTIFILIYGAGLRASEAATLRINDIDRSRSTIHIRQGKGNKDRYVILSPMMLKSLCSYWKQCRSTQCASDAQTQNDFIFPGTKQSLSAASIGAVYRRSKLEAGIKKEEVFMHFVMPLPRMHWNPVPICSPSSNFWGIHPLPQLSDTCG